MDVMWWSGSGCDGVEVDVMEWGNNRLAGVR